jgi:hypothetical protein
VTARLRHLDAPRSPRPGKCAAVLAWLRRPAPRPAPPAGLGPNDLMPELSVRIRLLEQLGGPQAIVEVDPAFVPSACTWCSPGRPGVTSVRVFGNPREFDVHRPLLVVDVCLQCALGRRGPTGLAPRLGAVGQALVELRPDGLIRIGVCE